MEREACKDYVLCFERTKQKRMTCMTWVRGTIDVKHDMFIKRATDRSFVQKFQPFVFILF